MPPRRKLAAVPDKLQKPSPDLCTSVEDALAAMTWLGPSDQALADVARKLAEEIEKARERSDLLAEVYTETRDPATFKKLQKLEAMCDVTKTVGWLGPQLQGVLRDLGGTPAARKAMSSTGSMGGRLADLRTAAATPPAGRATRSAAAGKRDASAVDPASPAADA